MENLIDMVFKSYMKKMLYRRLINMARAVIKLKLAVLSYCARNKCTFFSFSLSL